MSANTELLPKTFTITRDELRALSNLAWMVKNSKQNVGLRMLDAADSGIKITDRLLTRTRPEQPTDTERLDWLEKQFGVGLVHDDNAHWALTGNGMQSCVVGDEPQDFQTSFFIEAKELRKTAREAIDHAMKPTESEAGK